MKKLMILGAEKILKLPYIHCNQLKNLKLGMTNSKKNLDKTARFCIILSADSAEQFNLRAEFVKNTLRVKVLTNTGTANIIWN